MRILLIHAGGQSQRMPSASLLGKIFSPIPKGDNSMYQMLDIKLAMYIPLLPMMCPGIFITCADDFLVYDLGSTSFRFAERGFTALAHPSSVAIGTVHGVYIVKDVDTIDPHNPLQVKECLQVLQKPSEVVMYETGAVIDSADFPSGLDIGDKFAYTDSSFFFAHDVTKRFLDYLKKKGPVKCEIDAYGDFLQALGPKATSDYTKNVSNVGTVTSNLLGTRQDIFHLLHKTPLTLLIMNCSKFIHIGTTKEYINHFCCDSAFQTELGLQKDVFNIWTDNVKVNCELQTGEGDVDECPRPQKISRLSDTALGCVMHSTLPVISNISHTAVMEYCNFDIPINIGQSCILSNCEYTTDLKLENALESLDIPNNLFLHTVPVVLNDTTKYTTVVFDIKDNLKKVASNSDISSLPYLGKLVHDYATVCSVDITKICPSDDKRTKLNLWFANLFPASDTMTESLALSLKCVMAVKTDNAELVSLESRKLLSMAEILKHSDLDTMLKQRNALYTKIKAHH